MRVTADVITLSAPLIATPAQIQQMVHRWAAVSLSTACIYAGQQLHHWVRTKDS